MAGSISERLPTTYVCAPNCPTETDALTRSQPLGSATTPTARRSRSSAGQSRRPPSSRRTAVSVSPLPPARRQLTAGFPRGSTRRPVPHPPRRRPYRYRPQLKGRLRHPRPTPLPPSTDLSAPTIRPRGRLAAARRCRSRCRPAPAACTAAVRPGSLARGSDSACSPAIGRADETTTATAALLECGRRPRAALGASSSGVQIRVGRDPVSARMTCRDRDCRLRVCPVSH